VAVSNLPLVDKAKVVTYLRDVAKIQTPIIEVSNTFPSEDDNIAYGLYVDDVTENARSVNQLGVQSCASMYNAEDQFNILYISYQNDPQAPVILNSINNLAANVNFFDGYTSVEFDRDVTIGQRSEIHNYTFTLTRLEFNNAYQS
jgi:hypothetical protein